MKVLIQFHTPVNAGYAMGALERTFYEVASIFADEKDIFFSFQEYNNERVISLPNHFKNAFELNSRKLNDKQYRDQKAKYLKEQQFDLAFCFDLQPRGPMISLLRQCHIKKVISYWGSTMSGINSGLKLLLKRLEVSLLLNKPDLFIFESQSMQVHATHGRGVPERMTCVIPTGVDTDRLKPKSTKTGSLRSEFNIPNERKIAVYSGHMEARKGVHVLMGAFKHLYDDLNNTKWHLIVCGNRPGEEKPFQAMVQGSKAEGHITFAGYRSDLHLLMPECDVGLIASTGWDSFPMSALEMAACGLPILVSDLQGLSETVENDKTGLLFEPGNHRQLATQLHALTHDKPRLQRMATAARQRIVDGYSLAIQKQRLQKAIESIP